MIDHRLTAADAKPLATLHRRAFPGFFLSHLGEPFLRQFYLGFVDDETAVTVVARDELGEPYGLAVGTTHPAGFFSRLLLRRLMGFVFASAAAVLRDPRTFPRIISAVRYRGDTAPGHDGALLTASIPRGPGVALGARCSRRGGIAPTRWARAFLTTDADGNETVNRFHSRDGWTLNDRFVTAQGRSMNRYVRELSQETADSTIERRGS